MIFAKAGDEGCKLLEEKLKTTKDAELYRRLKIIQLSSLGETVSKLSKTFDVCKATVRDYINGHKMESWQTQSHFPRPALHSEAGTGGYVKKKPNLGN